jgi:hypothetical protein
MTRLRLSESIGSTTDAREDRRDGAPEGAAPRKRRLHYKDVAPTGAPSPLSFAKEGKTNEAQPARHYKRAAERWLFDI